MQNRLVRRLLSPDGTQGGNSQSQTQQNGTTQLDQQGGSQQNQPPVFDYARLADIVAGKQTVTEDTVLKNYFRNQGMTEEEMKQAIAVFKQQKAASQPDVKEIQGQLAKAQEESLRAAIENAAIMEAVGMGLDAKTIPYVLKMADLSNAVGQDGKTSQENIKNAINKVLEDVPQLKPAAAENKGFQIGGGGTQQNKANKEALEAAFGLT
ncbi:MAG: hypothetical protein K2I22_04355 [Lachnospiraceae bacterium]|nr:hypothetical protein [Lachnospiraceae bacterium]